MTDVVVVKAAGSQREMRAARRQTAFEHADAFRVLTDGLGL